MVEIDRLNDNKLIIDFHFNFIKMKNNTFKQVLQSAINNFIYCDNKEVDNSKLHFICKFSRLGLRLDNDIQDDIRDKVMSLLKANKGMMDKTIRDVIFNKEVVINECDYEVMRLIIFAFLFKLSGMTNYFIDGEDFYVY